MVAQTYLAALALALGAAAAPLEERQCDTCSGESCFEATSYSISSQTKQQSAWSAVSGLTCTSNSVDQCTVGQSKSVSLGVTVSAGVSIDLSEIVSIDSSVTFTTTKTTTNTIAEPCPAGDYVCGLIEQHENVYITGNKTVKNTGDDCYYNGETVTTDIYHVLAPVLVAGTPSIQFKACVTSASPNKTLAGTGLSMCPDDL